ncbi:hypothetical protein MAPG_09261 [Magnaporthiopsis poae ATCC 64411]|uniref:ADF-H domain-containing protein n=1 Tax=Magnaporthiopsis poae (strain ATCC 64411 / 73-15) TaxID=644358 RepID=A0A0C4E9H5_MAGP6|nr:hypothetical protein MAPG_09261 [Magnaporthiopsis poae ATCC 64411]
MLVRGTLLPLAPPPCLPSFHPTLRGVSPTSKPELFAELLSTPSHFALLVTIDSETIKPTGFLTDPSGNDAAADVSTFEANLDRLLQPRLLPNQALYVLLRRSPASASGSAGPVLVAATYIPDAAPVRQKMLFASTRLTLTRELGSEHFRESLFANSADELSAQGFRRHDAHGETAAPLTEEERTLGEVRRAEQEAGAGTGVREIHLSKNMAMPIAPDALAALKELAGDGKVLVMLKINPETETVELVPSSSSSPSSIADLSTTISATEPRFTFYRFTHTHAGTTSDPVLFFYTCPASPDGARVSIKFRMMYPLMKRAVLAAAEQECGLVCEKRFEVEEPAEITEAMVLADLHPQVEEKKAFSRPKRPGR